jgi:hypothetical protein
MALEVEYVERFSLLLDLQIAWRTVGVVVRGVGVNQELYQTGSGAENGALDENAMGGDGEL